MFLPSNTLRHRPTRSDSSSVNSNSLVSFYLGLADPNESICAYLYILEISRDRFPLSQYTQCCRHSYKLPELAIATLDWVAIECSSQGCMQSLVLHVVVSWDLATTKLLLY